MELIVKVLSSARGPECDVAFDQERLDHSFFPDRSDQLRKGAILLWPLLFDPRIESQSDGLSKFAQRLMGYYGSIVYVFAGRMVMQTKLKSRTIIKEQARHGKRTQPAIVARRLPAKRPPTHPGEMLLEEFLRPPGISQSAFAARLGISFPRLNEIIRRKRSVTPDTALRLARVLGMSADFWLGLQQDWDLWPAQRSGKAAAIAQLDPLRRIS